MPISFASSGIMPVPLLIPLAGASVDLWLANNQYYDSGAGGLGQAPATYLSCSRASTGYVKNSDGTLTSVGTNTLRTGSGMGLLIEDTRTNYYPRSQEIDSSGNWNGPNGVTVAPDAAVAPDGTTTSDAVIATAANSFHFMGGDTRVPSGLPASTTWSVYAKAGGYNFAVLIAKTSSDANAYRVLVDLTNGTSFVGVDGGSPTGVSTSVEALGSGWYRLIITMDAVTNGSMLLGVNDTSTWHSFTGDGSSGVYFWGAQIEVGAFASSYIPTTSTSATRAADSITITGGANTIIDGTTASAVVRIGTSAGIGFAANIIDSNGTNLLGFNASNNALASLVATMATINTANRSLTDDKLGLAWDGAGRALVLNGGTVVTDASAQNPSATQNLGSASATSNFIYAYVERLTLWNSRLANGTLQGFTI